MQSKWVNFVKKIFDDTRRPDTWLDEGNARLNCITFQIKRTLIDQYQQAWRANIQNSSKGTIYQLFKDSIELEKYFLVLDRKQYLTFVKFRTANHRLPIEVLRWESVPINERLCTLCDAQDVADEFHYTLCCKYFAQERMQYIQPYYFRRPNVLKFKELMNITSPVKLRKLVFNSLLESHHG